MTERAHACSLSRACAQAATVVHEPRQVGSALLVVNVDPHVRSPSLHVIEHHPPLVRDLSGVNRYRSELIP